MFPGGHQDLLMLCWRSRHYLTQLFSLFLSAVLTYGNTYVLVKRTVLQDALKRRLIHSLVISSES